MIKIIHGGKSKHSLGGILGWQERNRQHFPAEHRDSNSFSTLQANGDSLSGVLETLKGLLDSDQGGLVLNQQQGWTRLPTEQLSGQAGVEPSPKGGQFQLNSPQPWPRSSQTENYCRRLINSS